MGKAEPPGLALTAARRLFIVEPARSPRARVRDILEGKADPARSRLGGRQRSFTPRPC